METDNRKGIPLKSELGVTRLISDFHYELPEDFSYSGESHPGWEFVYVDRGKVSISADNATYILKKGELVCHKPFEYHNIKPFGGRAVIIVICFEASDEYMSHFRNKILSVNLQQKQYLNDIASIGSNIFLPKNPLDIVRDGQMDPSPDVTPLDLQFVKNAIQLLLISLVNANATRKQARAELYEHISQRKTLVKKTIEYLEQNLDKPISLTNVSDFFSYSLSSIKRIFKEETGTSIIKYHNDLRMEKARELLIGGTAPIGQIAQALGFSNVYYFSSAFRKKYGITASDFRSSHTGQSGSNTHRKYGNKKE